MCEQQTSTQDLIFSSSLAAKSALPFEISSKGDGDNGPSLKSCLAHHSKEQGKRARVMFENDEHPENSASNGSQSLQPLLGYDWIAGVLDVEKTLQDGSDDFYKELQDFRMQNKSECMHQPLAKFSSDKQTVLSQFADTDSPNADKDTHQCTFSYKMNHRLFPVPVHPEECCPVCKRTKASHPHTKDEPALVRVSIPLSILLPPYKHKAHRRSSFNPGDSLGLPKHCLLGMSNTVRSYLHPSGNLDLRSHLEKKNTEQPEDQLARRYQFYQMPVPVSLARHQFQHFSPKRKRKTKTPAPSTKS